MWGKALRRSFIRFGGFFFSFRGFFFLPLRSLFRLLISVPLFDWSGMGEGEVRLDLSLLGMEDGGRSLHGLLVVGALCARGPSDGSLLECMYLSLTI